ncbi:MAG: nuclear transport factor 2 family protein [Synergistaceae bacterium]|nr:nuclear transport factor 2 family protein [Synergistaceae bacterium]
MPDASAKLEIIELFSTYLLYCDERRFSSEPFAALFTDNAIVKMPFMRESKGAKDTQKLHVAFFSQFKSTHHVSSNYVFLFSSDSEAEVRCKLSSYYDMLGAQNKDGQNANFLTADVKFSVVHDGKQWYIRRLHVDIKNVYALNIGAKIKDTL